MHFLSYSGARAFKINRKGTDNLKVFNGDMGSFKFWKNTNVDHLYESTGSRRKLLKKTQEIFHVGFGNNAWTIAEDLEIFLAKWFSEAMSNRRNQLRGGPDGVGNGMEVWRRLHLEL